MNPGDKIYHQKNTRFLVYDGDQDGVPYGHVENTRTGESTRPQPAQQLLARGYWEDYPPGEDQMIDMPPPPAAVQQVDAPASLDSWARSRPPRLARLPKRPNLSSPENEAFRQESAEPQGEGPIGPLFLEDVAEYAYNAGFRDEDLVTFVAISMAENRQHDPHARGDTQKTSSKWGPSIGLWQMRSILDLGDSTRPADIMRSGKHISHLDDPQYNADAAYALFMADGLKPWSVTHDTHKGTANDYRAYLNLARRAAITAGLL